MPGVRDCAPVGRCGFWLAAYCGWHGGQLGRHKARRGEETRGDRASLEEDCGVACVYVYFQCQENRRTLCSLYVSLGS